MSKLLSRRAILGMLPAGLTVLAAATRRASVALGADSRSRPELGSSLSRVNVSERAVRVAPPTTRTTWTLGEFGRSVHGRPLERWDAAATAVDQPVRRVLVVCGIHGDERAAERLADAFGRVEVPSHVHLTIVPKLNPDGWVAGTRNNANDIDLNRNFAWNFFDPDGGLEPNSEPETRAISTLINDERPDLTVWVHQPLAYTVSMPGTPKWWSNLWAKRAGVDHRTRVVLVGGGGESWSSQVAGCHSILIEGRPDMTDAEVLGHALGLQDLLPHVTTPAR